MGYEGCAAEVTARVVRQPSKHPLTRSAGIEMEPDGKAPALGAGNRRFDSSHLD
jgi:hypothetical protein